MNNACVFPLRVYFSTELECDVWSSTGQPIKPGHAREAVARLFGFRTDAAMLADGLLNGDRLLAHPTPNVEAAVARAIELTKRSDDAFAQSVDNVLDRLLSTIASAPESLAVRLVLNLCELAYWASDFQTVCGYTLLTNDDLIACGDLACEPAFEDQLWAPSHRSTIEYVNVSLRGVEPISGLHQANPDLVLNVAANLIGVRRVNGILQRYMLRMDGARAFIDGSPNLAPLHAPAPSGKRDPR